MARPRKNKNEKAKLEVNEETKTAQTNSDSGSIEDVGGTPDVELQAEIESILEPFNEEKEVDDKPEVSATENADDEFIPKRKKKRETKEEKQAKDRAFKLPGRLVNRVTNRMMGGAIMWVDGMISKTPIPPELIYLSDDELNDEDNVAMAEECIKALNVSGNPIAMYLASMGGLIITNYIMIKTMMTQAERKGEKVEFTKTEEK